MKTSKLPKLTAVTIGNTETMLPLPPIKTNASARPTQLRMNLGDCKIAMHPPSLGRPFVKATSRNATTYTYRRIRSETERN